MIEGVSHLAARGAPLAPLDWCTGGASVALQLHHSTPIGVWGGAVQEMDRGSQWCNWWCKVIAEERPSDLEVLGGGCGQASTRRGCRMLSHDQED